MTLDRVKGIRAWLLSGILAISIAFTAVMPSTTQAAEPLKIGFSMTLTGGLAANGKAALVAMEIWREKINKEGGLLGRQVEFVYYDDATNPANVPGIYTKLLNVDKVDLVVSSYGTNLIAPAMPIIMKKKLVFMTLFGLAVNDRFNYDRYFQIMPSGPIPKEDWSRGFFELALAQSDKPKTVALLAADSEFAKNAVAGARTNAQNAGLKIVYDETYKPGTADFSPIVRAVAATKPDLFYVGSYPPGSVGIVRAANELGLDVKMFGGGMVGLQYAAFLTKLGPQLNGMVNYDFWAPEPTLNFPGINAFLKEYQARAGAAGVDPLGHYLPPYAYAYLEILGQAVNTVGSLDQAKLAEYIHKTTFKTVVGDVAFGDNGEWAKTRVLMVQFQGIKDSSVDQFHKPGKRVVLYPSEVKSGDFKYPYSSAR